jgi:D-alanine--poly(phosphoribitol) ligase subunit 1
VYVPDIGFTYKGRRDKQIKFKGYRIELQDIEVAIQSVIKGDLCSVVPFPVTSDGIIEGLVAVLDSTYKEIMPINEFKDALARIVPSYMIPNKIKFMV